MNNIPVSVPAGARLDAELIERAQRGDADAFAFLFQSQKARVYSLCLRMTNNVAEAEDLTQDAFLQVFRKLGTFRGDSALRFWFYSSCSLWTGTPCWICVREIHPS